MADKAATRDFQPVMYKVVEEACAEALCSVTELSLPAAGAPAGSLPHVAAVDGAPSAIAFLRDHVSRNAPVVFRNACRSWRAASTWESPEYLESRMRGKRVTVARTPHGRADSVQRVGGKRVFALPHEDRTEFSAALQRIRQEESSIPPRDVCYMQRQNNSLYTEFQELSSDVPSEISWASEALERSPDAVNVWIGGKRSVSHLHKDPYENLYAVLAGTKTFVLLPPFAAPFLYFQSYPTGRYQFSEKDGYEFQLDDYETPWTEIDPLNVDTDRFPLAKYLQPYVATVRQGDILYLPSLWYHQVMQEPSRTAGYTAAVNYWYDMDFGPLYAASELSQRLGSILTANRSESSDSLQCGT